MTVTTLRSDALEITCAPSYGCHLTSIRERRTGRELLWCRAIDPGESPTLGAPGEPSVATWEEGCFIGGWFAMFPTSGYPGPDDTAFMHGEAARRRWEVLEDGPDRLIAQVRLRCAPWRLTRTLNLTPTGFRLTMHARNEGTRTLEATYGEHPCFRRATFAGGQIRAGLEAVRVETPLADPARAMFSAASAVSWPWVGAGAGRRRADHIPDEPDGRLDHLGLILREPQIVIAATDLVLTLRVELAQLPHALLWERFDRAADGDLDTFAIEPSSAPGRGLADARGADGMSAVPAGAVLTYTIEVELTHADQP